MKVMLIEPILDRYVARTERRQKDWPPKEVEALLLIRARSGNDVRGAEDADGGSSGGSFFWDSVSATFPWSSRYVRQPVASMRAYLDGMDRAPYRAVPPATRPIRVLAALGPRMLQLAAERADGAHPYFVPPEHTARARKILGSDKLLAVEQAVVLESDSAKTREIARFHMSLYLTLPNYVSNLRRLGFSDDDFAGGGSDRLVDAIVAWGDITAVIDRIHAHQSAGADHVCIQVLPPEPQALLKTTGRRRSAFAPAV